MLNEVQEKIMIKVYEPEMPTCQHQKYTRDLTCVQLTFSHISQQKLTDQNISGHKDDKITEFGVFFGTFYTKMLLSWCSRILSNFDRI